MAKATDDEVVNELKRKNSTCNEIDKMLSGLGFLVKPGTKGKHHTYVHPQLNGFLGSDYDCGHGKNPVPKHPYFWKILKVLKDYETDLHTLNP